MVPFCLELLNVAKSDIAATVEVCRELSRLIVISWLGLGVEKSSDSVDWTLMLDPFLNELELAKVCWGCEYFIFPNVVVVFGRGLEFDPVNNSNLFMCLITYW